LVSGIYRMAPSDSHNRAEEELRLKATIRRLVTSFGSAKVLERIRAYPLTSRDDLERRAYLMLIVEADDHRGGRQATF
jgi:hypothetical protein